MQPILALLRKEFLQVRRTREMAAILFMVPLIQLLVLGHAMTVEVKHIRLRILDFDRSVASRQVARAFATTDRFEFQGYETSLEALKEDIQAWRTQMGLIIPRGFARDLRRGLQPTIGLVVDGLDGNTASVALGYARGILRQLMRQQLAQARAVHLLPPGSLRLVQADERMWYNLDLKSAQFMVPGIVVVLLTIVPMMLSAMSLVREKEIGTLEQLMVTPLKRYQLILGKLIPFLILAYVELAVVMGFAQLIFAIHMAGSYGLLAVLAFVYLFTSLGLGVFISTITHTQQQAMFTAWFFMVFMILMSGFFIPIENMPHSLQLATYLNPMRYFMSIVRDIFQKGSGLRYLMKDALPLAGFGIAIFSASVVKFHKRIA